MAEGVPADAVLLLDKDDNFTPEFEKVLVALFRRFDCDCDDHLGVPELHAFAQTCNGEPFAEDEIQEMKVCATRVCLS